MKTAFFSDVHANLEALLAVMKDAETEGVKKYYFLGDAVGYGPNPNECLEIICNNASICLMGNHDYAALGLLDTSCFNDYAKQAIDFTERVLTEDNKRRLANFELEYIYDDFHLVHSTPKIPNHWDYILTMEDAEANFPYTKKNICLIGHSHFPVIIEKANGSEAKLLGGNEVKIDKTKKYIINIGSVGQPRDNNPDSCYLIYDTKSKTARLKRVGYDIKLTQKKMEEAGLPKYLIERLGKGR